jgi:hypothetical protein
LGAVSHTLNVDRSDSTWAHHVRSLRWVHGTKTHQEGLGRDSDRPRRAGHTAHCVRHGPCYTQCGQCRGLRAEPNALSSIWDESVTVTLQWRVCHSNGERYWQARAGATNHFATGKTDFAIAVKQGNKQGNPPRPGVGRAWHPRIRVGSTWWSPPVSIAQGRRVWLAWVEAHTFYARGYKGHRDYYLLDWSITAHGFGTT